MSFSFTIPATPVADFPAAVDKAVAGFEQLLAQSEHENKTESLESVQAAIAAAQNILDSGVVGSGTVSASISGHANPDHQPTAGWANDFVSITISCIEGSAPAPTEAAAEPATSEATGGTASTPAKHQA